MDHFYAFLTFAVILALEWLARETWLAVYYRIGIPVNIIRGGAQGKAPGQAAASPVEADGTGSLKNLAAALDERFKNRPGPPALPALPALRFKLLSGGAIAFRETLFNARGGPRYFPVMHSFIKIDPGRGDARVTGWLNWYVVFLLVYLVLNSIADQSFLFVAVLVLVLFGLSYAAQAAVNRAALEEVRSLLAQTGERE